MGDTQRAPGSRLPRALRPFRHREYRLLATSLALSLLASGVWLVAIVWQVIGLGGGPATLSLVSAAASVGLLVSVLAGGVVADRVPRRRVLRSVEAVRVAATGLAATLSLTGLLAVWHLVVLAFVVGAAEAFYFPSLTALLPAVLPADELLAANGVEQTLRPAATQAFGPALAGLVVGALVPGAGLLTACLAYCAALVPLLALRIGATRAGPDDGRGTVLADLREGFRYLLRTGWLFASLSFAMLYALVVVGPVQVLVPFAVRDQTGGGPGAYAFVLAAYGAGGVAGSLLVASRRMPRRYLTVMLTMWGFGALPLAALGVADVLAVMAAAAFVVGLTNAGAGVVWGTLLQRRVPEHLLGRVSSLDFFVSLALMPVSMALAGPAGVAIGIPATFLVAAVVPAVLAIVAIVAFRLPRDETTHPLDA
ncbi:MFS transporter [Pseudonocardia endophytica]|uniref:Putative MFS family arabinose efflux permease n=1 Tax=Pseudonocardia endophytica TaxID=401976 RepID=A0A4R1HHR3_PSEEN|nr:MFS transporter [Pseudonocardia endophytica]TCK20353.1 putative MFS family arabinose efflux permease [Pseudonocardia endophytica]